jgi:hypothetical protein
LKRCLTVALILWSVCPGYAQAPRTDTTLVHSAGAGGSSALSISLDSLNQVFSAEDSLEIFDLIDSLLRADDSMQSLGSSQLAVRLGYNSNITSDNRTFNIAQFGLAPGVSYYHKSGAYADVTSYWSQEFNPNFYLTVTSAGYLHTFTKRYSIMTEYSHYFYNQPSDSTVSVPYTNNIGVSNYFEFKPLILRLDYYLYFGERTAHRIMPNIGLNLTKRNWLGLDRVLLFPSVGVIFGSELVTEYFNYTRAQTFLLLLYNRNNPNNQKPLYGTNEHAEFGIMNYGFTLPLSVVEKDWAFLVSYAYNMPKALPGETLSLESAGYLSFSITKYFGFQKVPDTPPKP